MAERSYFILTADPLYLPSKAQQEAALEFFKQASPMPNANGSYTVYVESGPVLLDSGEGMEAAICPDCEERVELMGEDEAGEEWWDGLQNAGVTEDLKTTMPCCGAE